MNTATIYFSAIMLVFGSYCAKTACCDQPVSMQLQDVQTVDNADEDFTKISLEDLVEKEVTVYERLKSTHQLTLQQGVLGGHVHSAGDTMFGYRYSLMKMDGNRIGSRDVSDAEVLGDFMVSPTDMTMQMHMLHFMKAPTDQFTWMFMAPFKQLSMNHVTRMGGRFNTVADGLGDVSLSGFWTFMETAEKTKAVPVRPGETVGQSFFSSSNDGKFRFRQHHAHFGLTGSIPTGSINRRGTTPMGPDQLLPYPMQLGSGTFDLGPSLTYSGVSKEWGWGLTLLSRIHLGRNYRGYSVGDTYDMQGWITKKLSKQSALEFRLKHMDWENYGGADAELNPMVVPTARTDLRGGDRTDLLIGYHYFVDCGRYAGNRYSLEIRLPIDQHLDGPQLKSEWGFGLNWNKTW